MAAFHSYLTIASCTTIPAQIKRNPATKDINSSFDKKQMPSQTRVEDPLVYRQGPATTWRWSPKAATLPRLPLEAGS
jgi:hypothetical protein